VVAVEPLGSLVLPQIQAHKDLVVLVAVAIVLLAILVPEATVMIILVAVVAQPQMEPLQVLAVRALLF
jgi:hypothetical protein